MVKLDETLALYQALILEMANKVRNMHCLALEILETGDRSKALAMINQDEFVNHYEEEINDQAQDALALLSPVATDLRIVIAGIKMATDLERIGDYAKNIARYVIKNGPLDPRILPKSKEIVQHFLLMYDCTIEAVKQKDVQRAFSICEEDELINQRFDSITADLQEALNNKELIDRIIPMVALLRNFERAKDHTKNICEHLIYEQKGQHIDFG